MACEQYKRIRSVDVGRPKHHRILVGVRSTTGPRGGHTEIIGGLRTYKGNRLRKTTTRHQHERSKHKNPTEKTIVHTHSLAFWSGKNTKYNTLSVNPRRQAGVNLSGFKGGFDPSEVLDKLLNDIPLGFELTKAQKEAVMREQDRREEKARKKMRMQKEYKELVESGGAW